MFGVEIYRFHGFIVFVVHHLSFCAANACSHSQYRRSTVSAGLLLEVIGISCSWPMSFWHMTAVLFGLATQTSPLFMSFFSIFHLRSRYVSLLHVYHMVSRVSFELGKYFAGGHFVENRKKRKTTIFLRFFFHGIRLR